MKPTRKQLVRISLVAALLCALPLIGARGTAEDVSKDSCLEPVNSADHWAQISAYPATQSDDHDLTAEQHMASLSEVDGVLAVVPTGGPPIVVLASDMATVGGSLDATPDGREVDVAVSECVSMELLDHVRERAREARLIVGEAMVIGYSAPLDRIHVLTSIDEDRVLDLLEATRNQIVISSFEVERASRLADPVRSRLV